MKSLRRKSSFREVRNRFLIVCEGEKTEPLYFKEFPIKKDVIEFDIRGIGYVTESLVRRAVELQKEAIQQGKPYNQVWCVFDRDSSWDSCSADNFNRAIQIANNHKIGIAYSNQAFELWYILHFEYLQSALTRDRYNEKLSILLGRKYEKNCPTMYEYLKNKQKQAINFADKLLQSYRCYNPEGNDPSTTVHHLVNEINKFLE